MDGKKMAEEERLRETTSTNHISLVSASSMFPGFRFSPTDVELISYYLKKKIDGFEKSVDVIPEIEICKSEPWDLPGKSIIKSDNEWFFFSPRGRKYPNGSQSKRATEFGYWKATGKERSVKSGSNLIGTKRTLVFHTGRAPKGQRTEWIMHEYCMHGNSQESLVVCRLRKNIEFHLIDAANQGTPNQRHLSITNNSYNSAYNSASEVGIDQTGISEVDRAVEESSKKCSSSYDSHSIEQIDSESESDLKPMNEVSQTKSSCNDQKDCDEDCFAEILNDDIIKLDDTSLSGMSYLLPNVASKQEAENRGKQAMQATTARVASFQGTANRRVRFRKQERENSQAFNYDDYFKVQARNANPDERPKCVVSLLSMKMGNGRLVSLVFVILTLVILSLSLLGGPRQMKMITHAALYKKYGAEC